MRGIVSDRKSRDLPPATSIPEFASEQEEAEYCSTHDTSLIFENGKDVSDGPPPDVLVQLDDAPRLPARSPSKPLHGLSNTDRSPEQFPFPLSYPNPRGFLSLPPRLLSLP
jgi:hypothetical protein